MASGCVYVFSANIKEGAAIWGFLGVRLEKSGGNANERNKNQSKLRDDKRMDILCFTYNDFSKDLQSSPGFVDNVLTWELSMVQNSTKSGCNCTPLQILLRPSSTYITKDMITSY
jgi:hypothetical protein